MGSSAVVYLLVFGLWKLLRRVRSLLRGACSDLEHWYHVDRFSVAPAQSAYPPRSGWLAGLGRLKDG